ncbi:MAG TPA: hypothetical protein VL860_09620 [Planctomycetota bacterium]|nr:hypothetical protein [Planctomycetota bacterium]
MHSGAPFRSIFAVSLTACLVAVALAPAVVAADAPAAPAAGEWQKFKGKPEPLAPVPAFATPASFLPRPERTVTFPAGGLAIDLPLEAALPDGRPIKAAVQPNRTLWIDLDGDGKPASTERFNPSQTGYGPITLPLKYKNETTAPYSFHLIANTTPGAYRLVTGQMIRYSVTWNRRALTLILIDQNNNGRYDEPGEDVVLVDSRPGGFLSKTVTVGSDTGTVLEIVVYADGTTIELRDYTGDTGILDPVGGYTPASSGVALSYLAAESDLARPGFSATFPRARVPVGSYGFSGAVLVNGKENVRVERGGLPPAAVTKDATVKMAWGGEVQVKYGFRREGDNLVFDNFQIVGKDHQEIYRPLPPMTIAFNYHVDETTTANGPMTGMIATTQSITFAAGALESDGVAGWKPLLVKHKNRKMALTFYGTYSSGVMGSIRLKDNFEFNPPAP